MKMAKDANPEVIIVSDMSSAIGSIDIEHLWENFGVVYAGAQKNFGISGLTFCIVRDDVIDRVRNQQHEKLPLMMDWGR